MVDVGWLMGSVRQYWIADWFDLHDFGSIEIEIFLLCVAVSMYQKRG